MLDELRDYNNIGDSRGIVHFTDVILSRNPVDLDSARKLCSFVNGMEINFSGALAVFEYLGLLVEDINERTVHTTRMGVELLEMPEPQRSWKLCRIVLGRIFEDEVVTLESVRFDAAERSYAIRKNGFPLSAAVLRNLLITLSALREMCDGSLLVVDMFEKWFAEAQAWRRRKMSLETLKNRLKQEEEQGTLAEEFVVRYEKMRLKGTGVERFVKRISEIDVAAGYDIVSYSNGIVNAYDRFIEVKSFNGTPHFYWSKNEMERAGVLGLKYFLYIVDVSKIDVVGYTPIIVCNPMDNLAKSGEWLLQPNTYLVQMIGVDGTIVDGHES